MGASIAGWKHPGLRLCDRDTLVRISPIRHGSFMSVRRTVTVSITPEQDALLRAFLTSGRYRSVSEVLRSALRLLERDEASALAAIQRSAAHGEANRG
ncbi:type II toxin-antitoxin system ParD family antitoxin [Methylobacterium sp. J-026]|uniref:ribbon-helix-helix domain-containing protein n=1 Tax=Methylobacterium sp. J-026 TaxID=2836624 RepID=UPI001FB94C97|nr:type II toxin-antitoxin system ParD family antitoxin [Methylobacterium sp. J-026]MCJ2136208.1 type II toxin-antitoxin system ParD family antitoxin [Methylobacterium sp. J-026]